MRIHWTARKHGVNDMAMLHAVRFARAEVTLPDGMTMLLGADQSGRFLEVGVLDIDEDAVIVHAMPMRRKYAPYLRRW